MTSILIQQIYPDTPGVKMLELTKAHHQAYCDKHGIDFLSIVDNPLPDYNVKLGSWAKVKLIQDALYKYENVIWLDADTLIVDVETSLLDAIQKNKIGACWHRIPQLNHWNVGALYIHNSQETREFISAWLERYPPKTGWLEQGVFNEMAKQNKTVVTLSDKWNATMNVSMVPDAVVMGFHGAGTTEERTEIMRQAMKRLFPDQEATTQGKSEVDK